MKNIETKALKIKALFIGGSILVLLGTAVLGLFAAMGCEAAFMKLGPPQIVLDASDHLIPNPEWEKSRQATLPFMFVIAPIYAIAGAVIGFFVSKRKAPPVWFFLFTGIIPGFLLSGGWALVHAGLAPSKHDHS